MSALGQKQTSALICSMSALPQKQTLVESPNIATAQPRAGSGIAAAIRPADGFGTLRISIAATTHSAPAAIIVGGRTRAARRRKAIAALPELIGALILSRAVGNGGLSDEILDAGRRELLAAADR